MKQKIDTIEAVDESGAAVSILVFESVQEPVDPATGRSGEPVGTRSFKLARGGLVRPVRDKAWRVVDTGELLQVRE